MPAQAPVAVAPVTRVTVIDATPLEDAAAWLRSPRVDDAEAALGRLVALYRIAAADVALPDVDPGRALAARVGYGRGEVVAEGAWEAARELPAESHGFRARRGPDLRPHERLAALLSARDAALACEELRSAEPARTSTTAATARRRSSSRRRCSRRWRSCRGGAGSPASPTA